LVQGAEDLDLINEGISSLYIGARLSPEDKISHDLARIKFMKIIYNLKALGWAPYIHPFLPRLKGEQAIIYSFEESFYPLLPDFVPSLEQWMKIDSGCARFYAAGIFLEVKFERDRSLLNPNQLGAYSLAFNISSKEDYVRSNFEENDRGHWQNLWVDAVKKEKRQRYAKEAELIKRGFTIDTAYQEAKIHQDDPVEP
jgi:hypothetical protein